MARKKTSKFEVVVFAGIALLVALASVPKEIWFVVGFLILLFLVARLSSNSKASAPASAPTVQPTGVPPGQDARPVPASPSPATSALPVRSDRADALSAHVIGSWIDEGYRIPNSPIAREPPRWLSEGEYVDIGAWRVSGGLIYVGTAIYQSFTRPAPYLIDPTYPVANTGDYQQESLPYWPSYDSITPRQRGAYLRWLIHGRRDPSADIGFVFLFFYGLEQRALELARADDESNKTIQRIVQELTTLLEVYGRNNSFHQYANSLLAFIRLTHLDEKLYEQPIPNLPHSYDGLPFMLRLIIGQATRDGVPLSAPLALAALHADPKTTLRTPAERCPQEFDALFLHSYKALYAEGMRLPNNATKLKLEYRPASRFADVVSIATDFPDINALRKPLTYLQELAESATTALEPYSRFLGRGNTPDGSLSQCLLLPTPVWPSSMHDAFQRLKDRVGNGINALKFAELLALLRGGTALSREEQTLLEEALRLHDLGIEPSPASGARASKLEDTVVVLAIAPEVTQGLSARGGAAQARALSTSVDRAYEQASLTVQLGALVANADGATSGSELRHLAQLVNQWPKLTPNQAKRLLAQLRIARDAPTSLRTLQKRLEALPRQDAQAIGTSMTLVAHADGHVSPEEVKTLQKIYKALGLNPDSVYGAVHETAARAARTGMPAPDLRPREGTNQGMASGIALDHDRIATLQAESMQVSRWLGQIFEDNEPPMVATVVPAIAASASESANVVAAVPNPKQGHLKSALTGLDAAHDKLVRKLLRSETWSRAEVGVFATEAGLMLDGALEHINDAAFEQFEEPLIEGEDPLVLNPAVAEALRALAV